MTRRKGILTILSFILAVLLLAAGFAGCGEYTPPTGSGTDNPVVTPPPVDPVPEDGFTVSLVFRNVVEVKDENGNKVDESVETPFTSANYSLITRLQAQWTEIDGRAVYRAPFDSNGVARINELDGDFNVTLILTDDFSKKYCYDPNPYDVNRGEVKDDLVASVDNKNVTVPLYELKGINSTDKTKSMWIGGKEVNYYTMGKTGAYSYTLKSREEKQFFMFKPTVSGAYSFMTLIDVTADEINPIVDLHYGSAQFISSYPAVIQDDGGAEGRYTKNVYLEYKVSTEEVGNVMIFNLHSESEKPDAYPLTVYFIFEWEGTYTRPKAESTSVPVSENFTKTPSKPAGTFEMVGDSSVFGNSSDSSTARGRHILNQRGVELADDGYYYYVVKDTDGKTEPERYRLYAVITKPIPVLRNGEESSSLTHPDLAKGYYFVECADGKFKNYYDFIMGTNGYASHCNSDGAYPVTAELKQFLQDYAVSQRYFNDGNGWAEDRSGAAYDSDEDSQWLFAVGLYK